MVTLSFSNEKKKFEGPIRKVFCWHNEINNGSEFGFFFLASFNLMKEVFDIFISSNIVFVNWLGIIGWDIYFAVMNESVRRVRKGMNT